MGWDGPPGWDGPGKFWWEAMLVQCWNTHSWLWIPANMLHIIKLFTCSESGDKNYGAFWSNLMHTFDNGYVKAESSLWKTFHIDNKYIQVC